MTVGLEVKDAGGKTGTTTNVIAVSVPPNTPPVPVIANPTVGTTWSVGDPIDFAGSATDAQDGSLPASALSWSIILHHCPSNCHTHTIESHPGVASGTFDAPDHDYPSFLEFKLTATDSDGASASVSRNLDPRTADVSFATIPTGLQLSVGASSSTAPFTRTVIDGSNNSIGAQTQVKDGVTYVFTGWSDGKAASHNITATDGASYTATFTADATGPTGTVSINGGAATTTALQVTLSVPATDALTGVAAVRLSDDGSTWVTRAYAASQAWTLPAVGGTRTVYVQWRDGAGNWSSTASDSITLDRTGPTVSGFQRSFVAGTTISADKIRLRLSWTGTDAVTGVARYEMQQRTDGGAWTSISTSLTSPTIDRSLATGHTYAFQVRGVDHAGNAGAWVATPVVRISRYGETSACDPLRGPLDERVERLVLGRRIEEVDAGASLGVDHVHRSVDRLGGPGRPGPGHRLGLRERGQGVDGQPQGEHGAGVAGRLEGSWTSSASRTVKIVVDGTAGHPRVDLDALVTVQ